VLGLAGVEFCLRNAAEFFAAFVADQAASFFARLECWRLVCCVFGVFGSDIFDTFVGILV
jgi:hypothetical protein